MSQSLRDQYEQLMGLGYGGAPAQNGRLDGIGVTESNTTSGTWQGIERSGTATWRSTFTLSGAEIANSRANTGVFTAAMMHDYARLHKDVLRACHKEFLFAAWVDPDMEMDIGL